MDITLAASSKWWGQHVQEDQSGLGIALTLAQRRSLGLGFVRDDDDQEEVIKKRDLPAA